ncbi:MAG: hypothetical protein HS122_17495 [Opitutaceae bacterium]|nr:hypothetical protein [Opitutaceae bacterium]
MRLTLHLLMLFAFATLAVPTPGAAAEIKALLVTASRSPGPSDPELKPYVPTLRRILRFESFRLVGEGSTRLHAPGKGGIVLGGGHQLQLEIEGRNSDRIDATWVRGKSTLMKTGLALRPGVPAVLGGPGTGRDGDAYAIIVIAR